MKSSGLVALFTAVALALTLAPTSSDAKRLGGARSSGLQRNMPARTAPDAPPARPAQAAPQQATAGTAAAAAAPKRSWAGPLAGLAAGLGLGALMSHFGLDGAMSGFLLMALLAMAAFFVIRLFMQRSAPRPAAFGAGSTGSAGPTQVAWPQPAVETNTASTPTRAFVPAAFDSDGFARTAKAIFIRLQAANDSADLDDLRRFTTPEMFAELRLDLHERGTALQQTDVVRVDAQVLDVADEAGRQIVSVRFHGQLREAAGAAPTDFDEIWHLARAPGDDSRGWVIAGIEQRAAA